MENKSMRLKLVPKKNNFSVQFCLGIISNTAGTIDSIEISWKRNIFDFSVDYNAIHISDILNISKYSMVKKNIKYFSRLFSGRLVTKCMYLNNEQWKTRFSFIGFNLVVELDWTCWTYLLSAYDYFR